MSCPHLIKKLCNCPKPVEPVAAFAPAEPPPSGDPEAPWGRKKDGTPYKRKPGAGRPKGTKSPWLLRAEAERAAAAAEAPPIAPAAALTEPEIDPATARLAEALADPERAADVMRLLEITVARDSFPDFCRQAWHVVEPATPLEWNWHHQLICTVLQALFEAWWKAGADPSYIVPILNTVFSVAPGSLKSRLIMVMFPAWCWLRAPGMKFICLSVNEDAAMRDARAARELIRSDWYQSSFQPQWTLKSDQDAISNYGNSAGGERLSKPSGSAIVGLRGDCLAGESMVSTEVGDMRIAELHAMPQGTWPRVWSVDHATGEVVLRRVLGTRRIPNRPIVEVRTESDNVIRCTGDHRIHVGNGEYTPAKEVAGRTLSVVREARDEVVPQRHPAAMLGLPVRDADVCGVYGSVPATRRRVRQACGATADGGAVLLEAVQDARGEPSGNLEGVRPLRNAVSSDVQEVVPPVLFKGLLRREQEISGWNLRLQLPDVWAAGEVGVDPSQVLQRGVLGAGALGSHAGQRQLELQGTRRQALLRHVVGEPDSVDPEARRSSVHGVWVTPWQARTDGAPYRPQSAEQRAGEPDHVVRPVPHRAPQVTASTCTSVVVPFVDGSQEAVDVYDLHVEGTHNFIAGGVLVHNCVLYDDPNNPDENAAERALVNAVWDTSIYSRVNSGARSLRIGVQQRVAAGDWTDHVLANQGPWSPENPSGWLNVVLPAEFEVERKFVMPAPLRELAVEALGSEAVLDDPRTREGESVHPTRMPETFLQAERRRWEGTGNYAAQYQQRPALLEGARVKRAWLRFCRIDLGVRDEFDELPLGHARPTKCDQGESVLISGVHMRPGALDLDWIDISLDCAAKKTERGSQWGILVVAGKGGRRFVLDDRTQRTDILTVLAILQDLVALWHPDRILVENKAAGPDIMLRMRQAMIDGDMPVVAIEEVNVGTLGKEARLDAAIPTMANGMLHLLDGAGWLENFVDELCSFPAGKNDDRVDALTQAINFHASEEGTEDLPDW